VLISSGCRYRVGGYELVTDGNNEALNCSGITSLVDIQPGRHNFKFAFRDSKFPFRKDEASKLEVMISRGVRPDVCLVEIAREEAEVPLSHISGSCICVTPAPQIVRWGYIVPRFLGFLTASVAFTSLFMPTKSSRNLP
jgi:hypothetical protein